jgi:hypothetical protein
VASVSPPLLPPADLSTRPVSWTYVDPQGLLRLTRSGRLSTEPFFGRSAGNRFDAPAGEFGVCYAASTAIVCFAETVIRSPLTNAGYSPKGELPLSESDLADRVLMGFKPRKKLQLINFTGAAQLRLGADATVSAAADYAIPQAWALALHDAFPQADGISYMSRHVNTKRAVAVFDRASGKLAAGAHVELLKHSELRAIFRSFKIVLI